MEHITISELTANAAPLIPYVGKKAWDGSPFLTYMQREGWSEAQLIGQDDEAQRTEEEILGFLQTWLFFGLLAEVCGPQGHRAYFVRQSDNGGLFISTNNLRAIYRQEKKRRSQESKEGFNRWQAHLVQCLHQAHSVLAKLGAEKVSYLSSPIILGVAALCDFVKKAVLTDQFRLQSSHLDASTAMLVSNSMRAKGWCPTDVLRLNTSLDVASFYLVAAQPRPDPGKGHLNCVDRACMAYQVDAKDYQREHDPFCERRTCKDLELKPTDLYNMLSSGSVPLTKYVESSNGESQVKIIRADTKTKYVAISHVWSDGFGNPDANVLYSCQAKRIAQYVSALMETNLENSPFWIDTLSCPVDPEEATDLAISMMRETYANAEKVLVLNSHLLNRKKPALYLEVLALVICTSWTRRLWTLQEGVLAKEVVFQFQDESVELGTAIALAQLELRQFLEPESLEYAGLLNRAALLHDIWKGQTQTLSEKLLEFLHSELQWRSTSVPSDEPLCISALLDFDLGDMVSVKVSDRKMQLWKLIKYPPKRILFWSGERLKSPGYRWAPDSLLGRSISYFLNAIPPTPSELLKTSDKDGATELTDDGLIIHSDSFGLGKWTAGISKGFFLNPNLGPLLWVTRQRISRVGEMTTIILPPGLKDQDTGQSKRLSLLLQKPAEYLLSPTREGAVTALLLSHSESEEDHPTKATIEDVCTIFPAYFLTEEQKTIVDDTSRQCITALEETEKQKANDTSDNAGVVAYAAGAKVAVAAGIPLLDEQPPSPIEFNRSDGEHCFISRRVDKSLQIEWNGAIWWTECSKVSFNKAWCLD